MNRTAPFSFWAEPRRGGGTASCSAAIRRGSSLRRAGAALLRGQEKSVYDSLSRDWGGGGAGASS
jgi:hypothetical protein